MWYWSFRGRGRCWRIASGLRQSLTWRGAVTASRSEGLPFNVMEAMHCGLPVVASRVKGHTDLIQDGVSGLLYPYGNAEMCAEAIRNLMVSDPRRQAMGQAARESVERYGLKQVYPQIISQYKNLLLGATKMYAQEGR